MQHDDGSNANPPDMRGKPADIKSKHEGDAVSVAVAGEVDLSTADQLDAAIREAEETDTNRIVVDLSAMSFVDSTGLAVLLSPPAQALVICPPLTLMAIGSSALDAGPLATDPSAMWKLLPWQGQTMSPLATLPTVHPMWVQTAVKALNVPALGCVSTIC